MMCTLARLDVDLSGKGIRVKVVGLPCKGIKVRLLACPVKELK